MVHRASRTISKYNTNCVRVACASSCLLCAPLSPFNSIAADRSGHCALLCKITPREQMNIRQKTYSKSIEMSAKQNWTVISIWLRCNGSAVDFWISINGSIVLTQRRRITNDEYLMPNAVVRTSLLFAVNYYLILCDLWHLVLYNFGIESAELSRRSIDHCEISSDAAIDGKCVSFMSSLAPSSCAQNKILLLISAPRSPSFTEVGLPPKQNEKKME